MQVGLDKLSFGKLQNQAVVPGNTCPLAAILQTDRL